jgi:hypothetical protein
VLAFDFALAQAAGGATRFGPMSRDATYGIARTDQQGVQLARWTTRSGAGAAVGG